MSPSRIEGVPARALVWAVALSMVVPVGPAARAEPATQIVRPGATAGWSLVNRDAPTGDETATPTPRGTASEFADGPEPAPNGTGSLRQILAAPEDSTRIEAALLAGRTPASITTLAYSTLVRRGRAGAAGWMQLLIDMNGDGRFRTAEDDVLTFDPSYQHGGAPGDPVPNQCGGVTGCVAVSAWQRWDAAAGGWWSLRGGTYGPPLLTLAHYQALRPAARIASDVAALRVSAGAGPIWEGFEGFVDAVAVDAVLYDFESFWRIADCSSATDDITLVQSAIDSAAPGFAVRLRGSCDFSAAAAHGGTQTGIDAAAVVLGSARPSAGVVVESDGAPGSAAIVGSGTQTAFFVPPGAADVTIRGLRFSNFARPIVIDGAARVTIGAAGAGVPAAAANSIGGGATMNTAVLAVATAGDATGRVAVRFGVAGGRSASYPVVGAGRLQDLTVAGNRIAYEAAGVPDAARALTAVDVRTTGPAAADGIVLAGNAVWFATNEFRSFDMNGVRIQGVDAPAATITRVRIHDNSIGRPEEIGQSAPAIAAGGRIGVLVHQASDVRIERNRVRAKISTTPGSDVPGGGIVAADTTDTVVDDNVVEVHAGLETQQADLGALGVVDDLGTLFGRGAGPPSTRIALTGNVVGTPGRDGVGSQRGIVVAGSSWVDATGNTIVFSSGPALSIGAVVRGPSGDALPRPVATSVLCGNDLDGATDDPNQTAAGHGAVASSNFPGGSLLATNGECGPAGIAFAETGGDTVVAETGAADTYTVALSLRPRANVTVTVAGGGQAAAGPATFTFTPANWAAAQTVTVEAVQDTIPEGTHLQALTHTASSADASYAGMTRSLLARILDDDPGSVLLTETGGSTQVVEAGATDTYTLVLGSRPAADVRIAAIVNGQLTVSPPSSTFTPADWAVPRTITVAAADDTLREGAHLTTITHRALSNDANFHNTAVPGLVVQIADNDRPPPPVITAPAEGSTIRVSGVVVSGKGEPNATLTLTEGAAPLGSVVIGATGVWSIGPIAMTEGAHTVTAVQTDAGGFVSLPAGRTFAVDLTPPQAPVILAPQEGQSFLFAGIEIRGTAEPGSTVVVTEGALAKSAAANASGEWRVVIVFTEGPHTVVATVYDGAGNAGPSSAPRTFFVNADGIPPDAPVIVSPVQDAIVASRLTVTGTTEPFARVEIWEAAIPLGSGLASSDGFFQIQLELESRTWLLRARAADQSFNTGPFTAARRVHVDGVAPTVSVRKPMPLPVVILLPDESVTAFGAAADNFGVERVEVVYTNFNGGTITRRATVCCPDRGTVQWADRATLATGRYTVTAFSYDLAGNRSRGSSVDVIRL